jgi:hypothetical protein
MLELFHYFLPAIIVSYFLLSSIFNADYRGVVVVMGIGLTVAVCLLASFLVYSSAKNKSEMCGLITIRHISGISNIPLSIAIYAYTACYLLYAISVNNHILPNLIPFMFFPLIILAEMSWISTNQCFTGNQILAATGIGVVCGVIWGFIIDTTKNKNLQYFTGNRTNMCLIPKKQTFKCKVPSPSK